MDGTITIGTKIDTSGLNTSINQMEKSLNKSINGMTKTVTNSFKSLKRFILALGIGALISRMFDLGDAVKRVDTINNYARVMGNLGVSAEDADKSIKILSDRLTGLPTALDDAALSVQRLTSANGNIAVSTEMFLALNNAILAGGASMELQKSALEQITQAYAKNKPDMMEWRTMMMTMPAQLNQIASHMGFATSNALGEALRAGKVSMNDFMLALTQMSTQFEEQARNATGGIGTSLVNLKTAFTRALADIMNAIGQANIADFFNGIAKAINKVVPYIAGFAKALMMLFGFGKKTTKNTDNAAKSITNLGGAGTKSSKGLNKATGSAKKLNKELKKLTSFDEMEVLQKLEKAGSSGSGNDSIGGYNLSGFDTSAFDSASSNMDAIARKTQEIAEKILGFLQPLKDNWQAVVGAIAGAKIALDLLHTSLGPLMGLGIGIALGGIVETILAIITFIKDPSWTNFGKILSGLETILIGVGVAMLSIPGLSTIAWITIAIGVVSRLIGGFEGLSVALGAAGTAMLIFNSSNPIGWIGLAVGAIGGLISALFGEEEQTKKAKKAQEDYTEAKKKAKEANDNYVYAVDNAESAEKRLTEAQKKNKLSGEELNRQVEAGELSYKKMNEQQREVYKAYIENEAAQKKLKEATKELNKSKTEETKSMLTQMLESAKSRAEYDKYKKAVIDAYKSGKITAKDAMDYLSDAVSRMDKKAGDVFLGDIPNDIKSAFGTEQYEAEWNKFEKWWKNKMGKLNSDMKFEFQYSVKSTPKGVAGHAKGAMYYPYKLPRLAVGGIINRPGAGVPYHGSVIGERGAEAVLPLTDSQQMMLLGEAIGRYISINATVPVYVGNRQIARELKKIEAEDAFAYNR